MATGLCRSPCRPPELAVLSSHSGPTRISTATCCSSSSQPQQHLKSQPPPQYAFLILKTSNIQIIVEFHCRLLQTSLSKSNFITSGAWNYVTVMYRSSDGTLRFFKNGKLWSSETTTISFADETLGPYIYIGNDPTETTNK